MRSLTLPLLLAACSSTPGVVDVPPGGSAAPVGSAAGPAPYADLIPDDIAPGSDVATRCPPELASACALVRKKDWKAAQTALHAALVVGGKLGLFHGLAANALLGRTCSRLGDGPCAKAQYAAARELWDAGAVARLLRETGPDEAKQLVVLGAALSAVGEAIFYGGEVLRVSVEAKKMPSLSPGPSGSGGQAPYEEALARWFKGRMAGSQKAEDAFLPILGLAPVPPPYWIVVASSRVARIWDDVATESKKAALPPDWDQETRRLYHERLDSLLVPMRQRAGGAYRRCAQLSAQYQVKAAAADECAAWVRGNPTP